MKNFSEFKKRVEEMVSANADAHKNPYSRNVSTKNESAEEIKEIIDSGNYGNIIQLSEKFLASSGLYSRAISYFSSLITCDVLTSVKKVGTKSISEKNYQKDFKGAVYFADTVMNPRLNYPQFLYRVLAYGAYYGLLLELGDKATVKVLPNEFCRTRNKNFSNINILEFDMGYFDRYTSETERKEALKRFPKDFTKGYNAYLNDRQNSQWYTVEDDVGIAFYYNSPNRPLFLPMLVAIANLNEYIDIEKSLDKQVLEKLIIQQIPTDKDGNFILDDSEASALHNGVVQMLRGNNFLDVLTTFADIKVENLGDRTKNEKDNLEKVERSVYNEAGLSPNLFGGSGATTTKLSVDTDVSLVFKIIEQLDNWLTYHVNRKFAKNSQYFFEVNTLPITHYNRRDILSDYLKLAEYGYNKTLPAVASGMKQSAFLDMVEMENDFMHLHEKMIPLKSSHTMANDAGGAPEKPLDEKADQTIKNQEVNS